MSVLSKLASMQGRSDEEPNKELGRELARTRDIEAIREIAENLWNKDTKIQSDCDGVMEEIGCQSPELIEAYVVDFLKLLSSKRNRRRSLVDRIGRAWKAGPGVNQACCRKHLCEQGPRGVGQTFLSARQAGKPAP